VARRVGYWREKETSDSASCAPGLSSKRESDGGFSERRGGQAVGKRKKRAIQQAAQCACCRREIETSDSVSGAVGVLSASE
jgi:hypothetical protein